MKRQVSILIVENTGGNCYTAFEILERADERNEILVVNTTETAFAYLKKDGIYLKAKTPDLILIDLEPGDINGPGLLSYIKGDKKISAVPVIVLSSAWTKKMVAECYQNHANGIITKPVNFEKFVDIIRGVKDFWINIAELPKINVE